MSKLGKKPIQIPKETKVKVENGKLIGQISQKDILIAALKLKGQNWK